MSTMVPHLCDWSNHKVEVAGSGYMLGRWIVRTSLALLLCHYDTFSFSSCPFNWPTKPSACSSDADNTFVRISCIQEAATIIT